MAAGRKLRTWHRRLGLVVAVFTIILSVTGLLLNHEPRLNLNKVMVNADWVLSWYGMEGVTAETSGFDLKGKWLVPVEGQLYLDGKHLGAMADLVGAASVPNMIFLADPYQITLLTSEGDLIERFAPAGVTGEINSVGAQGEQIFLRTMTGTYVGDAALAKWTLTDAAEPTWSKPASLPPEIAAQAAQHMAGGGLPLYRIILDLHSGRILSAPGRLAMDGAALVLIFLSVTGIWIWWPRR